MLKPDINTKTAERRILILGAFLLTLFILIAGVGVFGIMLRQGERFISNGLSSSLHGRVHLFDDVITDAVNRVGVITSRPVLINAIRFADHHPSDKYAISILNRGIKSFLKTGYVALAVLNKNKQMITNAGSLSVNSKISIPIMEYHLCRLEWNSSYYLKIIWPFKSKNKVIGYLSTEMHLPKMAYVLSNIGSLGASAELAICGISNTNMLCFPTRLHPEPAFHQHMYIHGHPLPMALALEGKKGMIITTDYRDHRVIATYMPIAHTGLGMVLKVDSNDLFAPIWKTLPYIIPALVLMVILGTVLLHWLVTPLIHYAIISEIETRENQRLLKDRDARLRTLFDTVDEGIVVIDAAGIIEEFNPAAEQVFGYTKAEVVGRNVKLLMNETDKSHHDSYIAHYLETGESTLIGKDAELVGAKKDGTSVILDLRLNVVNLGIDRIFVATMRDITKRKKQEEHIQYLATHDSLTGLHNRSSFLELVTQSLNAAKRHGYKAAIMFLDLDRFKQVNDTYGHETGDLLLIEFARRLRYLLREEDIVARQGGDEFIIALPRIDDFQAANLVAKKIYEETGKTFKISERQLDIDISIGIAMYPEDGNNVEKLLKLADANMYSAKNSRKVQT